MRSIIPISGRRSTCSEIHFLANQPECWDANSAEEAMEALAALPNRRPAIDGSSPRKLTDFEPDQFHWL
jgi:hypothetical protein